MRERDFGLREFKDEAGRVSFLQWITPAAGGYYRQNKRITPPPHDGSSRASSKPPKQGVRGRKGSGLKNRSGKPTTKGKARGKPTTKSSDTQTKGGKGGNQGGSKKRPPMT